MSETNVPLENQSLESKLEELQQDVNKLLSDKKEGSDKLLLIVEAILAMEETIGSNKTKIKLLRDAFGIQNKRVSQIYSGQNSRNSILGRNSVLGSSVLNNWSLSKELNKQEKEIGSINSNQLQTSKINKNIKKEEENDDEDDEEDSEDFSESDCSSSSSNDLEKDDENIFKQKVTKNLEKIGKLNSKVKRIKKQIFRFNKGLQDRVEFQEFNSKIEQMTAQDRQLNNIMKQLATKESIQDLITKFQTLERVYTLFVLKVDANEMISNCAKSVTDRIQQDADHIYLKKAVFNAENKRSTENIDKSLKQIVGIEEKIKTMNSSIQNKLDETNSNIQLKVDKTEFQNFKDWCGFFIHRTELDEMYQKVLPAVAIMKSKTEICMESIENFKSFLKRTDESILYRATRMDVQVLNQDVLNKYQVVMEINDRLNKLIEEFQGIEKSLENKVKKQIQSLEESVQIHLHEEIIEDLQIEVKKSFSRLDIPKIHQNLDVLKVALDKKADTADIVLLNEQKTHKQNTEKIVQFVAGIHKQLKQVNFSCLQFMKTFLPSTELDSANSKQQDITKAVGQLEQVFQQISGLSVQRIFKQTDLRMPSPSIGQENKSSQDQGEQQLGKSLNQTNFQFPITRNKNRSISPFDRTSTSKQFEDTQTLSRNFTPQPNQQRQSVLTKQKKIMPGGTFRNPIIVSEAIADNQQQLLQQQYSTQQTTKLQNWQLSSAKKQQTIQNFGFQPNRTYTQPNE